MKFKLPVSKLTAPNQPKQVNAENASQTVDNSGKQEQQTNLVNEDNELVNSLERKQPTNNSKRSRRNRRKNSQRKKNNEKQRQMNKTDSQNKMTNNISQNISQNPSNTTCNKLLNENGMQSELKNGLMNDNEFSLKNQRIPLRTMSSLPELMSNSNEIIKTKRLFLIDQKNFSTSFDQERTRIHNDEWYLKTRKLFDKYFNDSTDLGKLRRDCTNEHYWSSRRLTSHHSSSSEEWYKEIQDKMRKVENDRSPRSSDELNSITFGQLENNNIVNKMLDLQQQTGEADLVEKKECDKLTDKGVEHQETDSDRTAAAERHVSNEVKNESAANEAKAEIETDEVKATENNDADQPIVDRSPVENKSNDINSTKLEPVESNKELNNLPEVKNEVKSANHTDQINASQPEEGQAAKKKKSKKKFPKIGKRCALMYISTSVSF